MNRWIGGFRLLLGIATFVAPYHVGYCQDLKPKFQLESSTGVFFSDQELGFEQSPSVGLGIGYNITNFLQLNLALSYNPTHQRILQAASVTKANYSIYLYNLNFRIMKNDPIIWGIRPFFSAGVGGTILNPHAVELNLGTGETIRVEPDSEHEPTGNLGAGLNVALSQRIAFKIEYRAFLIQTNTVTDDGITTKPTTVNRNYLGFGFSTEF